MKNLSILVLSFLIATVSNAQRHSKGKKTDTLPAVQATITPQSKLAPAATLGTTTAPGTVEVKDINKMLEFTNVDFDFGKIPFGKPTEYVVKMKNITNDTVTLERVQAGCGCTTPKYEQGKKLAPNESTIVTLGFNGGTNGVFTKYVTMFFNNGLSKQFTFKGETFKPAEDAAPANPAAEKLKTNTNPGN